MKKLLFILSFFLFGHVIAQPVMEQEVKIKEGNITYTTKKTVIDKALFISDYQENVDNLLNSFKLKKDAPLNAKIFDIADKTMYSFLESSAKWKSHGEMMANMYFPSFFVNEKKTAFCFILYDSQSNLVEGYLQTLNYRETVDYLTYHEMGHCLEEYVMQNTGKKLSDNREDTELFADIFAMANFIQLDQPEQALKVIKLNQTVENKDYHFQPERLNRALQILKSQKSSEDLLNKNVNTVIDIAKTTFFQLKNDEILNPTLILRDGTGKTNQTVLFKSSLSNLQVIYK
jgi:hypothetical protein